MRKISTFNRVFLFTLILFLCSFNNNALAAIRTWEGQLSNDADWATASNWTEGAVPTSSDDVTISGGLSVYPLINENAACNSLTISGEGSRLSVNGDGIVFNVTTNVTVVASGEFNAMLGIVNIGGDLKTGSTSTIVLRGGNLNISGSWKGDNGEYAMGTISFYENDIENVNIDVDITGDCKFHATSVTGSMKDAFHITVGGDFSNTANTWNTVTGGTVTLTAASDGTVEVYSETAGQDLKVYNLIINDASNSRTFNFARSGANTGINIVNNFTITAGYVETKVSASPANHLSSFTVGGTFSMAGGNSYFKDAIESTDTYSVNAYSFNEYSHYRYYGETNVQSFNYIPTYGGLVFAGTQISAINNTVNTNAYSILEFCNDADITFSGSATLDVGYVFIYSNANVTISDGTFDAAIDFYMDESAAVTISGGALTVSGDFTINNPSNALTVSNGTFTCDGSFINFENPNFSNYGTITFSGGTVDLNGDVYIDETDASLTISGATVNFAGTDLIYGEDVYSFFTVNSDDFSMTSGSLTFDATGLQSLSPHYGGTSAYALTNINIENTTETVSINGSLTTTGTVTVIPNAALSITGNLTTSGGSATLESTADGSGSLIVEGTSTGNVTYNRWMTYDKWHIVSAPVEAQDISDLLSNGTNSIAYKNSVYGVTNYLEASNEWGDYYTSTTEGDFTSGVGYLMRRQTTDGTVSFTGTVATGDVTSAVTLTTTNGWNAVGNPYTSAIGVTSDATSTANFLGTNAAILDDSYEGLYVWDPATSDYVIVNNSGTGWDVDYVQAGQGFIVRANANGNITFTTSMQKHQTSQVFKSAKIPWWV